AKFLQGKKESPCVFGEILHDGVPPVVSLTQAPADPTRSPSASFRFSAADSGSGLAAFECQLDGSTSACAGAADFSGLSEGLHLFSVAATDVAGTRSTPTLHLWRVDTIAPSLTLSVAPPASTGESGAHFEFSSLDSGSGVAGVFCQLDSNPSASCSSPLDLQG